MVGQLQTNGGNGRGNGGGRGGRGGGRGRRGGTHGRPITIANKYVGQQMSE